VFVRGALSCPAPRVMRGPYRTAAVDRVGILVGVAVSALHVSDVSQAAWIAGRLAPFGSCVCSLVPTGFESYARVGLPGWEGGTENGLPREVLSVLCQIVSRHGHSEDVWLALWDGYGWIRGGSIRVAVGSRDDAPVEKTAKKESREHALEPAFPIEVLKGPKLRLPHRDYLLFRGGIASALALGSHAFGRYEPHSPDLVWPDDRTWFIATDVDLVFGYVGGTAALIADVTEDERLASVSVDPADELVGGIDD